METAPRIRFVGPCTGLVLGVLALVTGRSPGADPKPAVKKIPVGPSIVLEIDGKQRRVIVPATVVLQKGPLEQLLTRKHTKEHEAILAADIDARDLQKALLLAGAVPGAPVRFEPQFRPASGQKIKVTLEYEKKGKLVAVRAQEWIRDSQNKKALDAEWVFAGSKLVPNPFEDNKPIFLANEGDIICVSNFESALLDLTLKSSKAASELAFEANSDLVPAVGTKVTVVLEPVPPMK